MFDSDRLSVKFAGAPIASGVDAAAEMSAASSVLRDTSNVTSNHCLTRESSFASRPRCASLLSDIKHTQAPALFLRGNIKTMRTAGRPHAHPMTICGGSVCCICHGDAVGQVAAHVPLRRTLYRLGFPE